MENELKKEAAQNGNNESEAKKDKAVLIFFLLSPIPLFVLYLLVLFLAR